MTASYVWSFVVSCWSENAPVANAPGSDTLPPLATGLGSSILRHRGLSVDAGCDEKQKYRDDRKAIAGHKFHNGSGRRELVNVWYQTSARTRHFDGVILG